MLIATASFSWGPPDASADQRVEEQRMIDQALDLWLDGQQRVSNVSDRIRIAGADLCEQDRAPVLGAFGTDENSFHSLAWATLKPNRHARLANAVSARFALESRPRLIFLVPGSPAAAAGLAVGDLVTAIQGDELKRLRVDLDALRKHDGADPLRLDVLRGGVKMSFDIEAPLGCGIPTRVVLSPIPAAYSRRQGSWTGLYFSTGLLELLTDDDELAFVAGHELAHLILGHPGRTRGTRRSYEAQADYVGLYLTARAAFDPSQAVGVLGVLSRISPLALEGGGFYEHPAIHERSAALRATLAEIEGKRSRREPLNPEEELSAKASGAELDAIRADLLQDSLGVLQSDRDRIQNVAYRLALGGKQVCRRSVAPVLGASIAQSKHATLVAIARGSPASVARLRLGDRLLQVGGARITKRRTVFEALRAARSGPLVLRVQRADNTFDAQLPRMVGCYHGADIVALPSTDTDSHPNGEDIVVPTGLLSIVRDDDELAIAIAHQMGHQLMRELGRGQDEVRADDYGLRIAGAAGYDIEKAGAFWDRVATQHIAKITTPTGGRYVLHGDVSRRIGFLNSFVEKTLREQAMRRSR